MAHTSTMPPKPQDTSIRDEDQLAKDRSLDALQDALKSSLGYAGGADGLISMDNSEMHQFLGELGDKLAEHDRLIVAPPWLEKLQTQVSNLEGEVTDLRGALKDSQDEVLELKKGTRPVSPETEARSVDAIELERRLRNDFVGHRQLDKRLVALHHSVERMDEVAKLDVKAQLVTFGIELDRMRKTVEVAPSVGEIQALKDMYGGKLKALKTFLSEKLTSIERDVRMEASADATRIETALVEGEAKSTEELDALNEAMNNCKDALDTMKEDQKKQQSVQDQRLNDDSKNVETQFDEVRADCGEIQVALQENEELVQGLQINIDEMGERLVEMQAQIDEVVKKSDADKAETQSALEALTEAITNVDQKCQDLAADLKAIESTMEKIQDKGNTTEKRSIINKTKVEQAEQRLSLLEADLTVVRETDLEGIRTQLADDNKIFTRYKERTDTALSDCDVSCKATKAQFERVENDIYHAFPASLLEQTTVLQSMKQELEDRGAGQDTLNAATSVAQNAFAEKIERTLAELGGAKRQAVLRLSTLEDQAKETSETMRRDQAHVQSVEKTIAENHTIIDKAIDLLKRDSEQRFGHQASHCTKEVAQLRDHLKALMAHMEEELAEKIRHGPTSAIHLSAEDQRQYLLHKANECAKHANRFEQTSYDAKSIPRVLPRDMCTQISLLTESMADYIARKADVWAVEQNTHGQIEDVAYADNSVELRRKRIFDNFMVSVNELLAKRYPKAGILRLEARQKVTQKIKEAIEMSLSKADMVAVVGNSRFLARKLDVPTCAACDRPLLNRKNPYRGVEPPDAPWEEPSRPESSLAFHQPSGEMDRVQFRGSSRERADPHYDNQREYQQENVRRKHERGGSAGTITRGGFRMPSGGGLSAEIQQRMAPNTIEVQRSFDRAEEQDPAMQLPSIPGFQ